ncbi:uncharacterized protein LOC131302448 [Rhododendron vialii]|uniref:uncharacterized protein LOC131302448 n=1 Tax=Rhododendron vialii TaxID=182163 RepID=UPI00265E7DB5|nr:uncharacterized protein LOC131302448 [Rhododendron vialii]
MSEGNSTDGFPKTRTVLGDVTNRLGKRGLLQISGNSGSKSGEGRGKRVDDKEGDSQFTQKVIKGVENIVKEKCGIKFVVNNVEKGKRVCVSPRPCSEINSLRGNVISGISKVSSELKESSSFSDSLHLGRTDSVVENVVQVADASRGSCVSSILLPMASEPCAFAEEICEKHEGSVTPEVVEGSVTPEVVQIDQRGDKLVAHCKDIGADNFELEKCVGQNVIGSSRLPESLGPGSYKLERCIGLKGNGSSNSSAGVDLIKECSCSFCVKAGYILSDLHYQDIKGRIAALKKSQKEASILAQRYCRDKGLDKHNQENCLKSSRLESDLMGQWRSLFLHMEDILGHEGSQLEAGLLTLIDVRESCKTELETMNGMPSEKQ